MNISTENHDRMTGLLKPKYFLSLLEGILRHNGQVVLMLIDIDNIIYFNDRDGHFQGDKEIIKISREIKAAVGPNAPVCRWGGDEFGVILAETSLGNSREIAEKILANRQSIPVIHRERNVVTLTVSIGIAHFPDQSFNSKSLVEAAEKALLHAKDGGTLADGTPFSGRNRVVAVGDFLETPIKLKP